LRTADVTPWQFSQIQVLRSVVVVLIAVSPSVEARHKR